MDNVTLNQYETLQDWYFAEVHQYSKDINEHGCSSGVNGLIYDYQLTIIYNKYECAIWSILYDYTSGLGYDIIEYLNSCSDSSSIVDPSSFKRVLVWLVVEILASENNSDNEDPEEDTLTDLDSIAF